MKKFIVGLVASLGLCATVAASEVAPLQISHSGLWIDYDVQGVVVQIYPFERTSVVDRKAFVVINKVTFDVDDNEVRTWQGYLLSDFRGFSRTVVENGILGEIGVPDNQESWTFTAGATCDAFTATNRDASGGVVSVLNLERIAPNNLVGTVCYTCPSVAVGPFPPQCVR
jgi:hypothetical protein